MTTRFFGLAVLALGLSCARSVEEKKFEEPVLPDKAKLSSTGKNPYWSLEPGFQHVLEKNNGADRLTITVLNETKIVDGVETRIIEERETEDGKLIEVSRNYFAASTETGDMYYFGEDVEMYKDGKVTNHEGSWLAGVDGAKAGLFLPGKPVPGQRFFQEQAPKVAMDRCEIVSVTETLKTPAGEFKNVLKCTDSSAIEKGEEEKIYAAGMLIKADKMVLVKYGKQ